LEVLFPEKTAHFGSTVPVKNVATSQAKFNSRVKPNAKKLSAFWKYCSRKKQRILEVLFPEKTAHFGSTVPGKNVAAVHGKTTVLKRQWMPTSHSASISFFLPQC
jgi:hypothetical protein